MKTRWRTFIIAAFLTIAFTAFASANAPLTELVQKIQPAVVKIVVYDMNNRISGVGSGFFINRQGHLITNYHVLNGAFSAEVIAQDGGKYPIDRVIAQDRYADLIKVTVDIPQMLVHWLEAADATPNIAERVLVVGSPLGLAQSVSEGIVSAVREIPNLGEIFSDHGTDFARIERQPGHRYEGPCHRDRHVSIGDGAEYQFCRIQ